MNKDFKFIRAAELASISTYDFIGKHDKNKIDEVAVFAMRNVLKQIEGTAKVKCGEGYLDEAPMLFIGETMGQGKSKIIVDIAVDPIEGTINASKNTGPSISLISFAREDTIKIIPDMYMEKILFSKSLYSGIKEKFISLKSNDVVGNIIKLKSIKGKLSVGILDKPRHKSIIDRLSKSGINIIKIKDGDVILAISAALKEIDIIYGIGGAPEGSLMASLAISSGCYFEGRLYPYKNIWNTKADEKQINQEKKLMNELNLNYHHIFKANELVSDSKTRFIACFLTKWRNHMPIIKEGNIFKVETFFSSHGVTRILKSSYDLEVIRELKPTMYELLKKTW